MRSAVLAAALVLAAPCAWAADQPAPQPSTTAPAPNQTAPSQPTQAETAPGAAPGATFVQLGPPVKDRNCWECPKSAN